MAVTYFIFLWKFARTKYIAVGMKPFIFYIQVFFSGVFLKISVLQFPKNMCVEVGSSKAFLLLSRLSKAS